MFHINMLEISVDSQNSIMFLFNKTKAKYEIVRFLFVSLNRLLLFSLSY